MREVSDKQPAPEKWYFKSEQDGLARKLQDGITTRIFFGENVMLSVAEIAPHTVSTIHSHPEEQWGYLLEGECIRVQGGEEVAMKKGDFWYTPPDTPHGVRTGEQGAKIMDIFSPPRKVYTKPGEGLGATEYPAKSP
ncbi:MAG TPA: cupin domain-containing protein [Blastocatellia bacterium]|nr:cupin domain-containing protein [Blastocatellia bacterium]